MAYYSDKKWWELLGIKEDEIKTRINPGDLAGDDFNSILTKIKEKDPTVLWVSLARSLHPGKDLDEMLAGFIGLKPEEEITLIVPNPMPPQLKHAIYTWSKANNRILKIYFEPNHRTLSDDVNDRRQKQLKESAKNDASVIDITIDEFNKMVSNDIIPDRLKAGSTIGLPPEIFNNHRMLESVNFAAICARNDIFYTQAEGAIKSAPEHKHEKLFDLNSIVLALAHKSGNCPERLEHNLWGNDKRDEAAKALARAVESGKCSDESNRFEPFQGCTKLALVSNNTTYFSMPNAFTPNIVSKQNDRLSSVDLPRSTSHIIPGAGKGQVVETLPRLVMKAQLIKSRVADKVIRFVGPSGVGKDQFLQEYYAAKKDHTFYRYNACQGARFNDMMAKIRDNLREKGSKVVVVVSEANLLNPSQSEMLIKLFEHKYEHRLIITENDGSMAGRRTTSQFVKNNTTEVKVPGLDTQDLLQLARFFLLDALGEENYNQLDEDTQDYIEEVIKNVVFYHNSINSMIQPSAKGASSRQLKFAMKSYAQYITANPSIYKKMDNINPNRPISLSRVILPSALEKLDKFRFSGCEPMTVITTPDTVKRHGGCSFPSSKGLTSVNTKDDVSFEGATKEGINDVEQWGTDHESDEDTDPEVIVEPFEEGFNKHESEEDTDHEVIVEPYEDQKSTEIIIPDLTASTDSTSIVSSPVSTSKDKDGMGFKKVIFFANMQLDKLLDDIKQEERPVELIINAENMAPDQRSSCNLLLDMNSDELQEKNIRKITVAYGSTRLKSIGADALNRLLPEHTSTRPLSAEGGELAHEVASQLVQNTYIQINLLSCDDRDRLGSILDSQPEDIEDFRNSNHVKQERQIKLAFPQFKFNFKDSCGTIFDNGCITTSREDTISNIESLSNEVEYIERIYPLHMKMRFSSH